MSKMLFHNNQYVLLLSSVRKKWFVNLSSDIIPHDTQCFLQLGENFALPNRNKNNITIIFERIKSIENNIHKFSIDKRIDITNHSIPILNDIASSSLSSLSIDKKLSNLKVIKKFITSHSNIIFTHADKGNITVALDKDFYIKQVDDMFQDKEIYEIIKKDPTRKLTFLKKLLSEWKKCNYISDFQYKQLT